MQLHRSLQRFCFSFIILFISLVGAEPELLHVSDVHGIMDQILAEHVQDKQVTPQVIQHSLRIYIDQFDPERVYLLDAEVHPYLEANEGDLQKYVEQYKNGDFSVYVRITELGQNAIKRAREWRAEIVKQMPELVEASKASSVSTKGAQAGGPIGFAKSEADLKARMRDELVRFIAQERQRFGDSALVGKEDRLVKLYERHIRQLEKEYIYEDEEGKSLPAEKQENYQVMHILKSLASSLDAHTAFFNSEEAYDMRVRLEKGFQGIGVVLQEGIDGVVVTRLIDGGPAAKSGQVILNDRLVEINGKSIVDEPFAVVLEHIRGEVGVPITLGLKRTVIKDGKQQEETVQVQLKREVIVINEDRVDVDYEVFEDGIIGKITLYAFYEGDNGVSSENDMKEALKKLNGIGHLKGLILDLRDNTGGFLIQAVKVAGLFISNGVVVTAKYSNGEERIFRDLDGRIYYNGPLIVLTSRETASAAEIVAQALQDYGVGVIVGDERTYGKGSIQHQTVTDKNSASFFKVTVGKYYTVSGLSTQIRGVQADIVVPSPYYKDKIGEEFLDYALKTDKIDPLFEDNLRDISADLKPWYNRYYLPTLQKPTDRWKTIMAALKANSAKRMADNAHYQTYLNADATQGIRQSAVANKQDLQLDEAVLIVKDMILLKSSEEHVVGK